MFSDAKYSVGREKDIKRKSGAFTILVLFYKEISNIVKTPLFLLLLNYIILRKIM